MAEGNRVYSVLDAFGSLRTAKAGRGLKSQWGQEERIDEAAGRDREASSPREAEGEVVVAEERCHALYDATPVDTTRCFASCRHDRSLTDSNPASPD